MATTSSDPVSSAASRASEELGGAADVAADSITEAADRLGTGASDAADKLAAALDHMVESRDELLEAARVQIRAQPIAAIGIAFAVGMMFARLASR